ncbi:MAG: hypothetical protein ABI693_25805 [Bryobacteraceae bacterium]
MKNKILLDEDVVELLSREMLLNRITLNEAVNHFLRIGLTASRDRSKMPFLVKPQALALSPEKRESLVTWIEGFYHE